MRIKAFRAWRPRADLAASLPCRPYDTVTRAEAAELARGNPWSFLHVVRSDIDLPEMASPHGDRAYELARAALRRLIDAGALMQEARPCLYVYRQRMGSHAQTGVVACCHVADYRENVIRKHERTRADKEEDRTRHILETRAHTGLVFLAYRDRSAVDAIVADVQAGAPLYDVTMPDGVVHTVWRVDRHEALAAALSSVSPSYIADGHHRAAASSRAAERMLARGEGGDEPNWFPAVLFPAGQLRIMPYNRVVKDLNGLTPGAFLDEVRRRFAVREDVAPVPAGEGHVAMYFGGRWYGLAWREPAPAADPAEALDVARLQRDMLAPVLGIDDPRTSQRVEFVGGIAGTDALKDAVDGGRGAVAFSMVPVSVESMMSIADTGGIMPPKSTWFEPKLRSGLLVHTF